MPYRSLLLLLLLCSLVLQAESCWYTGPGGLRGAGEDDGNIIDDPEGRCTALPSPILPGLAFIPRPEGLLFSDGPLWIVNRVPQGLLAFNVDELPPMSKVPSRDVTIPADSDGDSVDGSVPDVPQPIVNGVRIESNTLGLITAFDYDEVLFFNPANIDIEMDGGLARYNVFLPADFNSTAFNDNDYPRLPRQADTSISRTAASTMTCIRVDDDAKNSDTNLVEVTVESLDRCDGEGEKTYYSSGTTGATVAEWVDESVIKNRLFVSLNNPDVFPEVGTRVYRPGTVLAYDFSDDGVSPVPHKPVGVHPSVIFTEGYNPRDVISYTTTSGDNFVLVVVAGALSFDGETFVKVELSEAFIEVIDPANLEVVDRVSLGNAALSGVSALDPIKGVLVVGSVAERTLYGVDLDRLSNPALPWNVARLDITPLDPAGGCRGSISGMSISDDLSEIYAVDYCDGTLTVVEADTDGTLHEIRQIELTAPANEPPPAPGADPGDVTLKIPGRIAVRPGTPGVSFEGSDLFVLVSQPEGLVCAQEVFGK
jgi:hypothetical protein